MSKIFNIELIQEHYPIIHSPLIIKKILKIKINNEDIIDNIINYIKKNNKKYDYNFLKPISNIIIEIGNMILDDNQKLNNFNINILSLIPDSFKIIQEILSNLLNIINKNNFKYEKFSLGFNGSFFIIKATNNIINRYHTITYNIGRKCNIKTLNKNRGGIITITYYRLSKNKDINKIILN